MVKPSPVLCARLRARLKLTTKQVNKGYYKGNRTGSMGAHTEYGNYVIDWRKVRNYNCPEIAQDFMLTPFVTEQISKQKFEGKKVDGMRYLKEWYKNNPAEVERVKENIAKHAAEGSDAKG